MRAPDDEQGINKLRPNEQLNSRDTRATWWRYSGVFNVDNEHIININLVFSLVTLGIWSKMLPHIIIFLVDCKTWKLSWQNIFISSPL